MSEFPKLARERLQSQQQAAEGTHPDLDLLAALAEQSLSGTEREHVLAHLAVCPQCRHVVALAFPAVEPQAHSVAEGTRAWHEWWAFRWGGLAAALAVILVAVYLARPRARFGQEAEAPEKLGEAIAVPSSPSPVPPPVAAPAEQKRAAVRGLPKKSAKPRVGAPVAGPSSRTPQVGATNAPTAGADETVAAHTAAPLSARNVAKMAPSESASTAGEAAQAPPTPMLGQAVGGMLSSPQVPGVAKARTVAANTRWSISASGGLQRSDDGGRTWKGVDVAGATGFRAVAAAGGDVWAGGAGGELFHSADAGDHWTRIALSTPVHSITGDITHIDLTGPASIEVTTSMGEKWVTTDAGATWSLASKPE